MAIGGPENFNHNDLSQAHFEGYAKAEYKYFHEAEKAYKQGRQDGHKDALEAVYRHVKYDLRFPDIKKRTILAYLQAELDNTKGKEA